jgi:AsmA protein
MTRPVKFALAGAGALLAAVVGLAALGLSLDPTVFKDRIAKTIKDTAGLDVVFGGSIKTSYFPSLGVEIDQVSVAAPAQAGGGTLARVNRARVSVKVTPLLSGRIEAGEIAVDGLELNLVRGPDGKLNLPAPPVKEVKMEGEKVVVITDSDARYAIDYQIEDVRITGARVNFEDKLASASYQITDFNLATGKVQRGKFFPVSLDFNWKASNPDASGRTELTGQASAVPEAMLYAFENASVKKTITGKGLPVKSAESQFTGNIRVDGRNLAFTGEKLKFSARAAGGALPDAGAGYAMAMDVKADLKAGTADLTGFSLDLMGFALTGEIHAVDLNQAAKATLKLASNDFNPKQVLEKLGVKIEESGTARFALAASLDKAKDTLDVTGLTLKALGLDITGELHGANMSAVPAIKAKLALAEFNPRELLARLGQPLAPMAAKDALTKLTLALAIEGTDQRMAIRASTFRLDGQDIALDATYERAARPRIGLTVKLAALDADRYMPPAPSPDKAQQPAKKDAEKPLDVPFDVTGALDIGKLTAAKLHMQNVSASFTLKDNVLDVNPAQFALYQGSLKAHARMDLRGGQGAPLSATVNASGIQVEPLLTDLTGKSKLSGQAALNASVTGKGQDAKHILASLAGKASFAVRNGAILGFNLSPDVFSSAQKLMDQTKSQGQSRTAFDVVSASFAIAGGVATTNDLLASVPPHKVTGQGSINLAAETLDMALLASFAKMAPIPVRLTGALNSPSVSVDAAAVAGNVAKGVIENVAKNPQDAAKALKDPKGALDAVGNILGLPKKK